MPLWPWIKVKVSESATHRYIWCHCDLELRQRSVKVLHIGKNLKWYQLQSLIFNTVIVSKKITLVVSATAGHIYSPALIITYRHKLFFPGEAAMYGTVLTINIKRKIITNPPTTHSEHHSQCFTVVKGDHRTDHFITENIKTHKRLKSLLILSR